MKTLRFIKMAFRHLIPAKLRMELKERSRYLCIDPDAVMEERLSTMGKSNAGASSTKPEQEESDDPNLTDGFFSSQSSVNAVDFGGRRKSLRRTVTFIS